MFAYTIPIFGRAKEQDDKGRDSDTEKNEEAFNLVVTVKREMESLKRRKKLQLQQPRPVV